MAAIDAKSPAKPKTAKLLVFKAQSAAVQKNPNYEVTQCYQQQFKTSIASPIASSPFPALPTPFFSKGKSSSTMTATKALGATAARFTRTLVHDR